LHVRAVDGAGAALVGWQVDARASDVRTTFADADGVTDDDGRCRLGPLPRVPHRIRLFAPALRGAEGTHAYLAAAQREDIVPAGQELVVRVTSDESPSCRLRGRAVDTAGRPIGSVRLIATRYDQGRGMVLHSHSADGRFDVGPLSPGTYVLALSVPGHDEVRERLTDLVLAAGETKDVGDVRLPEPARVVVRVRTDGDVALVRPILELCPAQATVAGGYLLQRDGTSGVFSTESIPARPYALRFFAANALPETSAVDARPGTTTEVELTARSAVQLELRIALPTDVAAGELRPRADVTVEDAEGKRVLFHLVRGEYDDPVRRLKKVAVSLAPGRYRVRAQDLWSKRTANAEVEVREGSDRMAVELEVK
jgi:hypothetical protein